MKKIVNRARRLYLEIIQSIAFYPTLITAALFGLALGMMLLDTSQVGRLIDPYLRYVINVNEDSARSFLSTMAGGMISLTVFSFSMVMVMLNQTASNYSPRILPGLISQKSNQVVLGIYLGTIIYLLMILINIRSNIGDRQVSVLSLFVGFLLGLGCLALFVYFIHTISRSVQIETLLKDIYEITRSVLAQEIQEQSDRGDPVTPTSGSWQVYNSPETGYFQQIQEDLFLKALVKDDRVVQILEPLGGYLIKGTPLIRVSGPEPDADSNLFKTLSGGLIFQKNELPKMNYLYGFKHIVEIAVKALSPGINDPGTAVNALDYLTDLLAIRMRLPDHKALYDQENRLRVSFVTLSFEDLIYYCFAEIRAYGKRDPVIIHRLLQMIQSLLHSASRKAHRKALLYQAQAVAADAKHYIHNPADRIRIARRLKSIEGMESEAAELYQPVETSGSSKL
ncbi:MAG: DUF2254 domain-containing protein [Thermodesulfobacteriota bacterium]